MTLYVYTTFCLSVCQGALGCFHLLVVVTNAALSTSVLTFVQVPAFTSLEYVPRRVIAGLLIGLEMF